MIKTNEDLESLFDAYEDLFLDGNWVGRVQGFEEEGLEPRDSGFGIARCSVLNTELLKIRGIKRKDWDLMLFDCALMRHDTRV